MGRPVRCWLLALALLAASPVLAAGSRLPSAAELIAGVQPAVVNIAIVKHSKPATGSNIAGQDSIAERKVQSSGFLIDPAGIVVTNQHVVADASEIIVTLQDGTRLGASVLAAAAHSDIALLKVNAHKRLPVVQFGDSDRLRPGDPILVVGNPLGLGSTVTAGIVSALERVNPESEAGSFFQIDAPLNTGNSGGPVFSLDGKVIGISTAFLTAGGEGGSVGLGLAIPSNEARFVVDRLKAEGRDRLGFIGIHVQAVTDDIAAAADAPVGDASIIVAVDKDSPAARAGLDAGDIVLGVDGKAVAGPQRLNRIVAASAVDSAIGLEVWRNGERLTLPVTVAELPGDTSTGTAASATPAYQAPPQSSGLGLVLAPLTRDARARLGLAADAAGVLVADIRAGGAAADRGISAGSAILRVGSRPVASPDEALQGIRDTETGGRHAIMLLIQDTQGLRWTVLPLR